MKSIASVLRGVVVLFVALAAIVSPLTQTAARAATEWQIDVGAESQDMAVQANYFFPGEIWINQGDSITWTFQTGEIHSVTFLGGIGGGTPVDSGIQNKAAPPFTLTFNQVGDFNYICVIHATMGGMVHVREAGTPYPYDQKYYSNTSQVMQAQLLAEGHRLRADGVRDALQGASKGKVTAGIGEGDQNGSIMIMRFAPELLTVKVGDTVTWTNLDPEAPHTITFNMDYPDPFAAAVPSGLDAPGHATINATTDQVNSGWLSAQPFPSPPFPPLPFLGKEFKVTFTAPGTYNYKCELHDDLGMTGKILVLPKG